MRIRIPTAIIAAVNRLDLRAEEWGLVIIVLPYNQKSPNLGDMKNTLIKIAIIAVFLFNTSHSFAYQASDRQKSLKNSNSADVNVRRDQIKQIMLKKVPHQQGEL